jgi:Arc/MetJ family transcription regulator
MPLEQFVAEAMHELSTATEEAAVGFAKRTLAASWTDASREIFANLNQ